MAIFKGCACIGINDGVGHWLGKIGCSWLTENMTSLLLLAIGLFGARVVAMRFQGGVLAGSILVLALL